MDMHEHKHHGPAAVLILLVGIAFLLVDLGVWNFWNIKWWTAVFLVIGIIKIVHSCGKGCCKPNKK